MSLRALSVERPSPLGSYVRRAKEQLFPASLAFAVSLVLACGDDASVGTEGCLDPLPLDCAPSYEPTYDMIFTNALRSCGASSTLGSCHSAEGSKGGLVLSNPDTAYDHLLGTFDGRARVKPGNPECSILMKRLESDDPDFRMPVGREPLAEGQLCAIRQWIARGAARP
jgi:hypothetical protein